MVRPLVIGDMESKQVCRMRIALVLLAVGPLVLTSSGCGPPAVVLYDVSGQVTVDGRPLKEGIIAFDPADGKGSAYSGTIAAGAFQLQAAAGPKNVSIMAYKMSNIPGPDGRPTHQQCLPSRYNLETTLTAEVKPQGDNTLSFALKSQ
jgi:hypothetical protein